MSFGRIESRRSTGAFKLGSTLRASYDAPEYSPRVIDLRRLLDPLEWWAQVVSAHRVHPHKH